MYVSNTLGYSDANDTVSVYGAMSERIGRHPDAVAPEMDPHDKVMKLDDE